MDQAPKRIAVLGCGSWGTALANHLRRQNHDVVLWGRDRNIVEKIHRHGKNTRYFPNDHLVSGIAATTLFEEALRGVNVVVATVPSSAVRAVAREVKESIPRDALIVSAAKGLENGSLKTMTEVWAEELGDKTRVVTLSGPSFAEEVLHGLPTAVTVAGCDPAATQEIVKVFHCESFRVYSSDDVKGVEIGGAAKNIIAMAIGMVDGAGLGANARAALLTRGLAEIQRLVAAAGGNALTAIGLSGLGDLFLTSTGDLSRNRRVGLALARGEKLPDILRDLGQVAEGVETAPKILLLANKHGVDTPITREVNEVLQGNSSVRESIARLLARAPKREQ